LITAEPVNAPRLRRRPRTEFAPGALSSGVIWHAGKVAHTAELDL
jgi:hypothetical protein